MNIDKKTSPVRWSDIVVRFLLIFLPLAFFFGSLTIVFYYKDVTAEYASVEKSEMYKVASQVKMVRSRFEHINTDLQYLARHNVLRDYLAAGTDDNLASLTKELLLFSRIKKIYRRIQLVGAGGEELIRIDMRGTAPLIAPPEKWGEGDWRSTFRAVSKLPRGGLQTSVVAHDDSGVEGGPVIRFSTPIGDARSADKGIIVLSYPIDQLIDDLQSAAINSPGRTVLVTPEGDILNAGYGAAPQTVSGEEGPGNAFLEEEWPAIRSEEAGQFRSSGGLLTYSTVYPFGHGQAMTETAGEASGPVFLWKTVSLVPGDVLAAWPEKILARILLLYSVCLVIIAISSFVLAKTSVRRRLAEKAMRENEEELRAINEAAANAIIAIDNNRNVLHWNPAAERLFQYTAAEVVDKPITSIISPPRHQSSFTKLSRKFRIPADTGSMEAKTIELYGYKKDGTEFPVEVSFSAFKKGEQWHTVGIIRDISARKEMEKEVLRANKFESLGVLSSGIAHDFNNLLTAIIGNINLVSKLTGTPPDSLELLKNAEKAARRAKALSQQLLTFSKEGMPIRKTTSIEELIRDSVEFALHGAPVATRFDIPDDLLLVDIDAAQIGQVIQNIVTNSRQAIKGSGVIHIGCRNVEAGADASLPAQLHGSYIEISIRDNGQGIPQRDLGKIFDPYFTTKEHGSGLGLTIANSIIHRHDGCITVDSQEDRGTVFTVYLPAAVDQQPAREPEKSTRQKKHFKILVVDNEEMLLTITGRMLVHLGHECVCARSAREALDLYKHLWKTGSPVDGVIIDLMLPGGMGGKETAGAIFDINSEARIIVSSGYANDPVMVDFDEYGFCAAIAKPFDMDELAKVIEEVLD